MSNTYSNIGYLLSLSLFFLLTTAQEDELLGDYAGAPVDISGMKETVSSLDDDLATYQKQTLTFQANCLLGDSLHEMSTSVFWEKIRQASLIYREQNKLREWKRTCQFGLNSHHCALADLDRVMSSSEWLSSSHSPGKRSLQINDPDLLQKYERVLEDIVRKREDLAALKSILQRVDYHLANKQKRTCLLELGGQCRTELASAIADQYYYLNSPSSPGKRRRRRSVPASRPRIVR